MLVSISDYRTASGDNTTPDAEIEASLEHVQAIIEAYTDRLLEHATHTETHHFIGPAPVILKQWPVTALQSLDKDGKAVDVSGVIVDKARGVVHHKNALIWGESVVVEYDAGYDTCPPDLKAVIVSLTTARLAGELDVTGPASARAVKRDTVYGVAAVEYDTSSIVKEQLEFYPELGPYVKVLERYRRSYELVSM